MQGMNTYAYILQAKKGERETGGESKVKRELRRLKSTDGHWEGGAQIPPLFNQGAFGVNTPLLTIFFDLFGKKPCHLHPLFPGNEQT